MRRALAPLGTLLHAIARIEARDDRAVQALPPMPVRELEAVSRALRHMADALRAAEDQRRVLGQRVITLQEDERSRLGRELHDEFGQHLTALHADAAWLAKHHGGAFTHVHTGVHASNPAAQEVVAAITGHVRHIQQVLRSMLTRLRPLGLSSGRSEDSANDDEPFTLQRLQALLQTLADSWDRRANASFRVTLVINPHDDPRPRAARGAGPGGLPHHPGSADQRRPPRAGAAGPCAAATAGRTAGCSAGKCRTTAWACRTARRALLQGSGLAGIHERVWALGADLLLAPADEGARRPGLLLQARLPVATAETTPTIVSRGDRMSFRVMLVDDHAVVRTGYRRLLELEGDMRVVAEHASAEDAYADLPRLLPGGLDVVVLDLSMPRGSGLAMLGRISQRWPLLQVLVFQHARQPGDGCSRR